jgi:hypothetical protein
MGILFANPLLILCLCNCYGPLFFSSCFFPFVSPPIQQPLNFIIPGFSSYIIFKCSKYSPLFRLLNFTLLGTQICNFSYSLIKLLAFSDYEHQLQYPGLWLNIVWNIGAFVALHAICKFWLFRNKLRFVLNWKEIKPIWGE